MLIHTPIDEAELLDLLDRILDKGLSLGAANLLLLGETDLCDARSRVSLDSMHVHIGYHPVRQTLSRYSTRGDKRRA